MIMITMIFEKLLNFDFACDPEVSPCGENNFILDHVVKCEAQAFFCTTNFEICGTTTVVTTHSRLFGNFFKNHLNEEGVI